MKYTFPEFYGQFDSYLICLDAALVPLVAGALQRFEQRRSWHNDAEYEKAYNAFAELQIQMTQNCAKELIEANNRIYRLLDTALYGRAYTKTSIDPAPLVIEPAIPTVPDTTIPVNSKSIVDMLDKLPGILDVGWFGLGGHKATIADIVEALRIGSNTTKTSLWGQLQSIISAGGNIASVADLIQDIFFNSVETAEEGGVFALLAASAIANMAVAGSQSAQLQRLIDTLDGGGIAPNDSILGALRGTTEASTSRNVIDAVGGLDNQDVADKLQQMVAELQTNNADNDTVIARLDSVIAALQAQSGVDNTAVVAKLEQIRLELE